jgi:diguanylate cyclase (GGDEF)-like protein
MVEPKRRHLPGGGPGDAAEPLAVEAFRAAPAAMVVVRPATGAVLAANRAMALLVDEPVDDLVGRRWPAPLGGSAADLDRLVAAAEASPHAVVELRSDQGEGPRWWRQTVTHAAQADGRENLIVLVEDRTEEHRRTSHLEHLVDQDELTGVWNRRRFGQELRRALDPRSRHGIGIVLFDVDGFKGVNDAYGHAAGDTALAAVAGLLRRRAPAGSLVARLAGDEFAVLVAGATDEETSELCLALTQSARTVDAPGISEPIALSAGWTVAMPGADPDQRARDAMIEADVRMYAAKARARSGPRPVAATPASPVPATWLPPEEPGRRDGPRDHPGTALELWAHPVVSVRDGQVVEHDVVLEPSQVGATGVPAPEVSPAVLPLAAVADVLAHLHRDAGRRVGTPSRYLVHLPGLPVGVGAAVGWVRRAADDIGLAPGIVSFAVDETVVLGQRELVSVLSGLRRDGFGIALTDFGRDVGGLRLVADLAPDEVWLHPSLVGLRRHDLRNRALVEATVGLARTLHTRVGVALAADLLPVAAELGIELALVPDRSTLRPLGAVTVD